MCNIYGFPSVGPIVNGEYSNLQRAGKVLNHILNYLIILVISGSYMLGLVSFSLLVYLI